MFIVIDGSALMCQQYYGSLPESIKFAKTDEEKEAHYNEIPHTEDGLYTNAICGYLQTLLGLLYYQGADHIAVCLDTSRETTFRRQIYPEYKAQRQPTPFPLVQQLQMIRSITRELGIQVLESPEFEADDYAGTLARKFEGVEQVCLLTKDRDYLQLVDDNVHVWLPQPLEKLERLREKYGISESCPPGYHEYTKEIVFDEIGVWPEQITDWKGISGDPSDNLPGVKGVADKTAIPLLEEYGTLEAIYGAIDACMDDEKKEKELVDYWKEKYLLKRSPMKNLKEGKDLGLLCKELAKIKTDVPIDERIETYNAPTEFYAFIDLGERYKDVNGNFCMQPLLDMIDRLANQYDAEHAGETAEGPYEPELGEGMEAVPVEELEAEPEF